VGTGVSVADGLVGPGVDDLHVPLGGGHRDDEPEDLEDDPDGDAGPGVDGDGQDGGETVKLTAQIAVMTMLECLKAGWPQTSRGAVCLAMPRVKGRPAASEAQAMPGRRGQPSSPT
jgi:hypothetical protein